MSAIVSIHELGLPMKTNLGSVARHIHRVLAIDFLHCTVYVAKNDSHMIIQSLDSF
jgi:hypothetical protein